MHGITLVMKKLFNKDLRRRTKDDDVWLITQIAMIEIHAHLAATK